MRVEPMEAPAGVPASRHFLSPELRLLAGLFAAWVLGFAWFLLDRSQVLSVLPPGSLSVALECVLEASMIAALWPHRRRPEYRCFFWFACSLLPGDFSYGVLHYVIREQQDQWLSFCLTTLPYSIAYILGSVAFFQHVRPQLHKMRRLSFLWLPVLLIVPAILGILLPLLVASQRTAGWTFELNEIAVNSLFAVTFFFWSSVALLLCLDPVLPFLGLAGIISQLGNWGGISAYLLHQNTFTFGEYEFLWLCGVIAFWYALVVVRRQAGEIRAIGDAESAGQARSSLVVLQRMTIIGLISASLIAAVLLSPRDIWSYRIVFFGIGLGSYIALIIGEVLSKQIVHYATLFGRVVNPSEHAAGRCEADIPVELWKQYEDAFQQERTRAIVRQNLAEQASQVAHDIRSPLGALSHATQDLSHLPEAKRAMIRSAIGRIQDIANSLLSRRRLDAGASLPTEAGPADEPRDAYLLSSLIERVIAEKRLLMPRSSGITIDLEAERGGYGIFAVVQPAEFERVVSNLLNNSLEAIDSGGTIAVRVGREDGRVLVDVQDNGRGIPAFVLARLGRSGGSFGKLGGTGLGLHHARSRAEEWGGRIEVRSNVGEGTTVSLSLPEATPPGWFVPHLRIDSAAPVVILDDEPSIHQVWESRLGGMLSELNLVHLKTASELRAWLAANQQGARNAVFLVDHDLEGSRENGLGLIEALGLTKQAILVTGRFEDKAILAECRRLRVRLIPKTLVPFVPITLGESDKASARKPILLDAVLIDDDELARELWRNAARDCGKTLQTYCGADDLLAAVDGIHPGTPIYVDSRLADGFRGEALAKDLYDRGWRNLYLATGQSPDVFPPMYWIKGIIGKSAPWAAPEEARHAVGTT